jgi:hypothetical protein
MNNPLLKKLLPTVIGILIFIIIIFIGFRILSSRAADVLPSGVTISEVTANSAKITWTTDQPSIGAIKYGTAEGALNFYATETAKDPATSHSADLTLLSPNSTYYFQIQIGDKMYDNGGVSWTFSTKANGEVSSEQPSATPRVLPTVAATPVQRVEVPGSSSSCSETDCNLIKAKLGNGCDTQYYIQKGCVKGIMTSVTPTASTTATLTP